MASEYLAFVVTASTVLCACVVIAAVVMRAVWARREREALTATDLVALEESAVILVEQITAEGDRIVAEIDRRSAELRELLRQAEAKGLLASADEPDEPCGCARAVSSDARDVIGLASNGLAPAEIARRTGVDCAEVKLMLKLDRTLARR